MVMVTDYRGHCRTLLPVQEINLEVCTLFILKQIIWQLFHTLGELDLVYAGNLFNTSMHHV